MLSKTSRIAAFAVLCFLPLKGEAGAGISLLTVFDPVTSGIQANDINLSKSLAMSATRAADRLHEKIDGMMRDLDVWGIEVLTREAATSSALACLGTAAPVWSGDYTTSWVTLLNTNEMITYAVLGNITQAPGDDTKTTIPQLRARFELWDFVLNHRIVQVNVEASAAEPEQLGENAAPLMLAALQLYFAEVIEIAGNKVLINVGSEALTTGDLVTCFAHGHLGAHPSTYPAHGHREEDDHFIGSPIYARYRGTVVTSATIHSHSRSQWRLLLRSYPPAYQPAVATASNLPAVARPAPGPVIPKELRGLSMPGATPASSPPPLPGLTAEEARLLNLAHLYSGRPTGRIRITGFLRPNSYYRQEYAVGEITSGIVIPGSFLRHANNETSSSLAK